MKLDHLNNKRSFIRHQTLEKSAASFYLPNNLLNKLEDLAETSGMTRSVITSILLDEAIRRGVDDEF